MFMDGSDLYDDDVPSTTAAKAERWTNMSTSERNRRKDATKRRNGIVKKVQEK